MGDPSYVGHDPHESGSPTGIHEIRLPLGGIKLGTSKILLELLVNLEGM